MNIPVPAATIGLLILSNIFMTFAWYGHLRYKGTALPVVILASWGLAFFEYLLQVPANRIGYTQAGWSLAQLKIAQEVITLVVFVVFAALYFKQSLKWDYLWAALCMVGAVYFVFRGA